MKLKYKYISTFNYVRSQRVKVKNSCVAVLEIRTFETEQPHKMLINQ